ncbi:Type I Iterative PKS [Paecilomyces lecythidis]
MGSMGETPLWATEPIAIIGMSCKFAGDGSSPEKLWDMMVDGRSAWSEVPESRYNHKGQYHPDNAKLGTTNVKGAHFIKEDVGLFDAAFFGFPAEVASAMDPQFRIQLESTYEALENAGLPLPQVAGSNTSVYASVFTHDYHDGILRDGDNLSRSTLIGTFSAMASNRISHFFDLQGPSMSIDTGCSGALVSLHQAVLGLRAGEADMSIVCGSNLLLAPDCFKMFSSLSMLSPDGKCYAFDSRANGYGRGEGVGTVIIKRLSDALAAGDPIRAIIRESALNQDGKSETITSPSQAAQIELMHETYRRAGLNPNDTQYFEAHGTGTPTGDAIEARSIEAVFGPRNTGRTRPLYIGSVKTSLGHTEAASGIAALVKAVLALEKGQIPPNVNFEKPNPKLQLDEWGMKVVTKLQPWPASDGETRRASINNFGYGGTNSHVILEDARAFMPNGPARIKTSKGSGPKSEVFVLYGRDEQACQRMVSAVKEYLQARIPVSEDPESLIRNVAWTLGMHRTRFPSGWVAAHTVQWQEDENILEQVIQCLDAPQLKPVRLPGDKVPRIGMVFTGQGAQWNAMGRELIEAYPLFKSTLLEAEGYLEEFGANWSLTEELMRDAATTRVNHTALSIPICVAVQIALVRLLTSWGIEPTAVTSHSSGEIGAAYAAGALNLRQAMAVGYYRAAMAGVMTQESEGPKGAMAAIGVGESAARVYLDQLTKATGKAVVACVNSPSSVTIAGDETAVQKVLDLATQDGVFARRLKVETGYHSHHMIPIAESYRQALRVALDSANMEDTKLDIIFSSPVTGGRITHTKQLVDPEHWVSSLLQPVEFVNSFTDMVLGDTNEVGGNIDVVLEVGPHTALGSPIKEILSLPEFEGISIPYMGCLVRKENARDCMLTMALNLLRRGQQIKLSHLRSGFSQTPRILTDLPSYPWNHSVRHWTESRHNRAYRARDEEYHHLLGFPVSGSNPEAACWRQQLRVSDSPWLRDHVVQGSILYPGAGYICLAIEAIKQLSEKSDKGQSPSGFTLRDVEIHQALVVPDNADGIEVQTVLQSVDDKVIGTHGWKRWEISSVTTDSRWTQHAKGFIQADFDTPASKATDNFLSESGYTRRIDPDDMWANMRSLGLTHGPSFRNISSILQDGSAKDIRRCVTTIDVPDASTPLDKHVIHPATLDSIVVSSIVALPNGGARDQGPRVPRSIQKLWISSSLTSVAGHRFACNVKLPHFDAQKLLADISLVDGQEAVLEIQELVCQSLGPSATARSAEPWNQELCTEIKWAPDLTGTLSLGLSGSAQALKEKISPANELGKYEKDVLMRLRRVCVYFCHDAVQNLNDQDIANLAPHHVKYHAWIQETLQLAATQGLGPNSDTWANDSKQIRDRNITLAASQSVEGELVCRIGPMLV